MLHSKTRRRKKQRVAASADIGSEVPNLGVARALFLILVLHVAAIAAIFIHNRVNSAGMASTEKEAPKVSSAFATEAKTGTRPSKGEHFYFVATGDTYERVARLKGVDLNELKELNKNKGLGHGAILRIPANKVVAPVEAASLDPEPTPGNPSLPIAPLNSATVALSQEVTSGEVSPGEDNASGGDAEPALSSRSEAPVRVAPNRQPSIPVAVPVALENTAAQIYVVKTGDTPWGIARKHGVSVQELLKANDIQDARRMRVSMKLRIPAR